MRELWEQHDVWTRLTIESIVFNLPDEPFVIRRLLRNPQDFADALRPFYGRRIAAEFARLLNEHLVIAAQLVRAAQIGDGGRVADAERRWFRNARKSRRSLPGSILSGRAHLDRNALDHLRLVQREAVQMLQGTTRVVSTLTTK